MPAFYVLSVLSMSTILHKKGKYEYKPKIKKYISKSFQKHFIVFHKNCSKINYINRAVISIKFY